MGISISIPTGINENVENLNIADKQHTNTNNKHVSKEKLLQLPLDTIKKAVQSYYTYQISPILDENGYKFFMMLSFSELNDDNYDTTVISQLIWEIFSTQDHMS